MPLMHAIKITNRDDCLGTGGRSKPAKYAHEPLGKLVKP
jgi:hypothetical protein